MVTFLRGISVSFWALFFLFSFATIALAEGWVEQETTAERMNDIDAFDENTLIAVGDDGLIVYSTDGGASWTEGDSGTTEDVNGLHVYSSASAIAVGDGGLIIKTTDLGATWSDISESSVTDDLWDVHMYDNSYGLIAGGSGSVLLTSDGGRSWTEQSTGYAIRLYDVFAVSETDYWAVGNSGKILQSRDSGASWSDTVSAGSIFYEVDFVSSSEGWVVGSGPSLMHTTDGGASWSNEVPSDIDSSLYSVEFHTSDRGTFGTYEGDIYATTDGGSTWEYEGNIGERVYAIHSEAMEDRWIAGGSGGLWRQDAVAPDAPEDLAVDGGSPTYDTTPKLTWSAADDTWGSVDSYEVKIGTSGWFDAGDDTEYTWLTSLSDGEYTAYVRATDTADNTGDPAELTFEIDTSSTPDSSAPSVSSVWPTTAETGTATTYYIGYADETAMGSCELFLEGSSVGSMTLSGDPAGTASSLAFSIVSDGEYTMYAVCQDAVGNETTGASTTITVSSTTSSDTTGPEVGEVSPTSATLDEELVLTVSATDDVGVATCFLFVDGDQRGVMSPFDGEATISYTFLIAGTHDVHAKCYDTSGNLGLGDAISMTVTDPDGGSSGSDSGTSDEEDEAVSSTSSDALIKMACSGGEAADDPCKAVYYYGDDGERHAFPNEKVFFTWYEDFDDVIIVTDEFMASISLGDNVTYRPGMKMVTFQTTNEVYCVDTESTLRHVTSEDAAEELYGEDWNQQIDDISDAFFGNYSFGDDVDDSSDFDVDDVRASVDRLADHF